MPLPHVALLTPFFLSRRVFTIVRPSGLDSELYSVWFEDTLACLSKLLPRLPHRSPSSLALACSPRHLRLIPECKMLAFYPLGHPLFSPPIHPFLRSSTPWIVLLAPPVTQCLYWPLQENPTGLHIVTIISKTSAEQVPYFFIPQHLKQGSVPSRFSACSTITSSELIDPRSLR